VQRIKTVQCKVKHNKPYR